MFNSNEGEVHQYLSPFFLNRRQPMTRKHFQEIAEMFAKHNVDAALVSDFMEFFIRQNNRFDRARFLKAIQNHSNV